MKKVEILKLESLSREPMVINGFLFEGNSIHAQKVAIIGAMQGDALLPLHCSSQLVNFLNNTIKQTKIFGDILVIPSINHYALNIGEKYWPIDKTNLNMMFPGYNTGETTQRIAAKIFEALQGYDYGISLEINSDQTTSIPHIKLLKTGWEDIDGAKEFGFKLIHHKELESIDTVTLQYNWQLWETKAYSVMCPSNHYIDKKNSDHILQALIRFLNQKNVIDYNIYNAYASSLITKRDIKVIKTPKSGIYTTFKFPGEYIYKGELIGQVTNSLTGEVVHKFKARQNGMIISVFKNALIIENSIVYKIAKIG